MRSNETAVAWRVGSAVAAHLSPIVACTLLSFNAVMLPFVVVGEGG